ncbi:hypothetical protein TGAM01_v205993 [Trichoderma gamsii]|uniref:Uncharacterized protein n=1 Tax=Trichoderma gamsii TaxID=398673 RepID=A0A2P4ZLZ1_9HYPO|nr:hypothetical protein TGAM01_v205993 [Trichoderma gamsii]PON25307.1 hypothetical protein TGAM01_v205993 [Trichoderma gamsii]
MPDEDRADLRSELWVMHCHAPPCAPVFIAAQQRGTGTYTPLYLSPNSHADSCSSRYSDMPNGVLALAVDPPTHKAKLFFQSLRSGRPSPFSLPKTDPVPVAPKHLLLPPRSKKRKKPNRVTWAPSTARPSTPKLGTLREPEAEPRYLRRHLAISSLRCTSGPRIHSLQLQQLLAVRSVCCDLSCSLPPRADEAYRVRNELRALRVPPRGKKKTHWGDLRTVPATRHLQAD